MANLLSDQAVREIRQIGLKVKELEQKFAAQGARPNQRRYNTFARIDSNIADETYTADQVIGKTSGVLGEDPSDPIRWDDSTDGVGFLYAVDYDGTDATGIVPVFPYSDGTTAYWGFQWQTTDELEHVFKVTANDDGTSVDIGARRGDADYEFTDTITIYSGRDGDMETIEKTSTENVVIAAGTNHIYYEINNGTSEVWEAEAKKSSTWTPSDIEDDQQKLGWLVAEVNLDGTDITIGQEVFHNPHLRPKQFLPSFSPVHTDGFVKITEGRVNLASESTTIAEATFSTSSVLYLYVEVTSNNGDTTPTVTSTLQTSGTEPTYSEENSSGDLTRRYVIGKCTGTGNVYQPYHVGDLNLGTLYQPDFDDDMIPGSDPTQGQFIAYEDATSIGEDKDVFLKARMVTLDFEGGEIADNTDDGTAYFGGDTTNLAQDYVSTIETDSTEIVFKRAELSIDVDSGLTQSAEVAAEVNEAVISAGEEWIHIEPGAKIKHVNATIVNEADTNHWGTLSFDGTTATWDPRVGGTLTGTEFEAKIDIRRHVYAVSIDGTESTDPEDQTNYKYRDCDDPTSFIVCPTETDKVFRDMGVCWELVGETTDDDDDTVTDQTFDDCTTCIGDGTDVNVWLKCSDDSTAALIDTPSSPDDDYAWLCLSSVWVKCYNWAVDEGVADNPDYLEQCGTTPLDCTDLVGWPGSDDFGGTGCNSGAVNDTNYDIRWSETVVGAPTYDISGGKLNAEIPDPNSGIPSSDSFNSTGTDSGAGGIGNIPNDRWTKATTRGTLTIASGVLNMAMTGGGSNYYNRITCQGDPGSDDFTMSVEYSLNDFLNGTQHWVGLDMLIGGVFCTIERYYGAGDAVPSAYWVQIGGTYDKPATSDTSGKLTMERIGNTLKLYAGTTELLSATVSGSVTNPAIHFRADTGTYDVDLDNYILVDGDDNDILITGGAATESSLTLANNIPSQSGDFASKVDINVTSITGTGGGPQAAMIFGNKEVGYINNGSVVKGWYYRDGATYTQVGATPAIPTGSKTVEFRRTGSLFLILIDSSVEFSGTYTGSDSPKLKSSNFESITTNADGLDNTFDNFIVNDNSGGGGIGDDIYIDPTGESCP